MYKNKKQKTLAKIGQGGCERKLIFITRSH